MSIATLILNRSQTRRRLFDWFFANEGREYYLRELERLTKIPVGNIRRELNRYTGDKLFLTKKVGNLLFYRLNTAHPLYREIKSILATEIGVEAHLRRVLSKISSIEVAFIFGSFAKGTAKSDSDIDLMIIGNPSREALAEDIGKLENELHREINYQIRRKETFRSGRASRNSFIIKILKEPKMFLIGSENDL